MLIWKIKTALKTVIIVNFLFGALVYLASSIAAQVFPISRNRYLDYQFGTEIGFLDFFAMGLVVIWALYSVVYESKILFSILILLGLFETISFINEFELFASSTVKLDPSQTLALFDVVMGCIEFVIMIATLVCFFIAGEDKRSSGYSKL